MHRGISKPLRLAAVSVLAPFVAACTVIGPPQSSGDPTSGPSTKAPAATQQPTPARTSTRAAKVASPFASLSSYLAQRQGHITAAVYNKRTGQTWVFHPGVAEYTASIVKVEIMGTALHQAGSPTALSSAEQDQIPTMIENSDNTSATNMLAAVGGPDAVKRFDVQAGLTDTQPSHLALIPGTDLPGWGLTTTTALDEVTLVRQFAYPSAVLSTASRHYGLSLMEHIESDQAWGISYGISTARAALKNGWLPLAGQGWQINSIGWVHGNGRDYVIAVLTGNNPDEQYGIDTIQAIAASVYRQLGAR